jgi:hypothetical protein
MVSVADRATGPDRGRLGGPLGATHRVIACPECGLPAEVTERFSLSSTDGPVEHVALACLDGHYFRMPAEGVSPAAGPPANSPIGFSRLPGTLGTVANEESGRQHF